MQVQNALEDLVLYMQNDSPEVPLILNYLSRCFNVPVKRRIILELSDLWEKLSDREALKTFITVYVIRYNRDPMPKNLRRELALAQLMLLMSLFIQFAEDTNRI